MFTNVLYQVHQQPRGQLQLCMISIDKSPRYENKNNDFDSALAFHIFEIHDHLLVFDDATLISIANGSVQCHVYIIAFTVIGLIFRLLKNYYCRSIILGFYHKIFE